MDTSSFIEHVHNSHLCETCIILGTSSSLDQQDILQYTNKYFTIAVNGWGLSPYHFDAYILNHTHATIKQHQKSQCLCNYLQLLSSDTLKIVWDSTFLIRDEIALGANTYSFAHNGRSSSGLPYSTVPPTGPGTVVRCAVDLALTMGFKRIILAGFDYDHTLPYSSHILSNMPYNLHDRKFKDISNSEIGRTHENNWKNIIKKCRARGCSIYSISPLGKPARPQWDWFPYMHQNDLIWPSLIPKICHFIWLGDNPPALVDKSFRTFQKHHADWDVKLWRELPDNIPQMIRDKIDSVRLPEQKSDILRYWLIYQYGGIYLDSDTITLRNMDNLRALGSFCAYQGDGRIANGLIGCSKYNQSFYKLILKSLASSPSNRLSYIIRDPDKNMAILPYHYFYILATRGSVIRFLESNNNSFDAWNGRITDSVQPFSLHLWGSKDE